jgi:hypothetical protein
MYTHVSKGFREQLWIDLLHIFRQVTGRLQILRRCRNIVYIYIYSMYIYSVYICIG